MQSRAVCTFRSRCATVFCLLLLCSLPGLSLTCTVLLGRYWHCLTCNLGIGHSVCAACVNICHAGHNVQFGASWWLSRAGSTSYGGGRLSVCRSQHWTHVLRLWRRNRPLQV